MRLRSAELIGIAICLAAAAIALDVAWGLLGKSSASLAFGVFDEPAHLATCALALLALAATKGRPLSRGFCVAALVATVAIDLDHLPQELGWDGFAAGAPRPYLHSGFAIAAALAVALVLHGGRRRVALGVAFGLGVHLLRDAATGPGIAPALPFSAAPAELPYAAYAVLLAALVGAAAAARRAAAESGARPVLRVVQVSWLLPAALLVGALAGTVAPDRAEAAKRVAVGVYLPGADRDPGLIDGYTAAVGHRPAIVHVYRDWSSPPFAPSTMASISSRGAVPMVTWEPWENWGEGVSLWEIANGAHDAYLVKAAQEAAAWGGPVFVRFAHEMNGDWYPWGRGNNGNTAAAFKAAWRRVVRVFRWAGARNVRWAWTPYVQVGKLSFKRFYPGDRWVDWVGLDGFNWGRPFISFGKIFGRSYRTLARMTRKPMIIAETGSVEQGGNKAAWIRRAMKRALPRFKRVHAVVWWSAVHPDGPDWRVDTSPGSLRALARSLRAPRFGVGQRYLLRVGKPRRGRR